MSFYGDTTHLHLLSFSLDQMSRTLGDLSVHGACGGRDRKWRSLWGSLASRAQEKGLALESDKFTAGTYLLPRHRGPHSREVLGTWLAQERSSGRRPSLLRRPLVTWLLPIGVRVPTFMRLKPCRGSGGSESCWKQPAWIPSCFYLLFPWLCSFTLFVIKSLIHHLLMCLFNLSICLPPPPFHLRGWVILLGVYQS